MSSPGRHSVLTSQGSPVDGSHGQPPNPSKPTYSKRGKITIVACVPCRRRKTKCDGRRPICSQCQSRDGQCHYDMSEDQRRLTYLRENVEQLGEEKNALESVLWHLKNSTEDEAAEILRRLRSGTDPQSLVQQIQASRSLTQVRDGQFFSSLSQQCHPFWLPGQAVQVTYRADLSPLTILELVSPYTNHERLIKLMASCQPADVQEIIRRLRQQETVDGILEAARSGSLMHPLYGRDMEGLNIDMDYTQGEQTFGLMRVGTGSMPGREVLQRRAPNAHTPPNVQQYQWTSVTENREFIDHLLSIYFMWQHAFFQNFPEDLFRQDMAAGRTKYCSKVLVNAICATGCLLSDRPEARGDPNDPQTAGAGFFEEGMRLLNEADNSSIPTTAGVFLLSHVEGYRGRLSAMWGLVGRSARMALDLNLHLKNERSSNEKQNPERETEELARKHAFWGCFISDQVTSFTIGRLPQILTTAITIDLPSKSEEADQAPWGPDNSPAKQRPGARATTFYECASLSKIVNSTLLMFFAPSQTIKGSLLLDEYNKYLTWYGRLPKIVASTENAPPHVLCLHMYYHAAVLLLFRPFLRAKFTTSNISPSDLCRQSANSISDLFAKHLSLYGSTGMYTFQLQCLLAACTIHIINLPAISSATALTIACKSYHDLIHRNTWALGSLVVIKGLVEKWSIILTGDVEEALYQTHQDLPTRMLSFLEDPDSSQADIFRPAKRSALRNTSSSQMMQKRPRLAPVQNLDRSRSGSGSGSGGTSRSPGVGGVVDGVEGGGNGGDGGRPWGEEGSTYAEVAPVGQQPNYLFAPFPNQQAPLMGPIHTSTSSESEWSDELTKVAKEFDGLSFEGDGWFDPFMGWQDD